MDEQVVTTTSAIAKAFNAWMDRYTNRPNEFEREWKTVNDFLTEKQDGKEPSYGEVCAAYLQKLLKG